MSLKMEELKRLISLRERLKERMRMDVTVDGILPDDWKYQLNEYEAKLVRKLIKFWFNTQYGVTP